MPLAVDGRSRGRRNRFDASLHGRCTAACGGARRVYHDGTPFRGPPPGDLLLAVVRQVFSAMAGHSFSAKLGRGGVCWVCGGRELWVHSGTRIARIGFAYSRRIERARGLMFPHSRRTKVRPSVSSGGSNGVKQDRTYSIVA